MAEETKRKPSPLYDHDKMKTGSKNEEKANKPKEEAKHPGSGDEGGSKTTKAKENTGTNEKDIKKEAEMPANIHERHKAEREITHKRHEGERRDLHGNHKEEHRKMQARHEEEHNVMHKRQEAELANQAPGAGAGSPGAAPAIPPQALPGDSGVGAPTGTA
jgi:hypothetical protein